MLSQSLLILWRLWLCPWLPWWRRLRYGRCDMLLVRQVQNVEGAGFHVEAHCRASRGLPVRRDSRWLFAELLRSTSPCVSGSLCDTPACRLALLHLRPHDASSFTAALSSHLCLQTRTRTQPHYGELDQATDHRYGGLLASPGLIPPLVSLPHWAWSKTERNRSPNDTSRPLFHWRVREGGLKQSPVDSPSGGCLSVPLPRQAGRQTVRPRG